MKNELRINPLLSISADISVRTHGLCSVGPGPGGIGISNPLVSEIALMLSLDPVRVSRGKAMGFAASVSAVCRASRAGLSDADLQRLLSRCGCITRDLAETALYFSGRSFYIPAYDYYHAFSYLAETEMNAL